MKTNILIFKAVFALTFICVLSMGCKTDEEEAIPKQEELSEELKGEWIEMWSMTMQYTFDPLLYDPLSKIWFRGNYDPWSMDPRPAFGIKLNQDGTFILALVSDSGVGGCQTYTAQYIKGYVWVNGNEMTFKPLIKRTKYHSVCNPGNDFDKDEALTEFTWPFSISTTSNYSGQNFQVITFTTSEGSTTSYYQLINQ